MHSKKDNKKKLLWLQGVTCNGNTHSFLNLPYLPLLLSKIELLYFPTMEALYTFEEISECKLSCDILVFEGAFDPELKRNDILIQTMLEHYSKNAEYVIAVGSCASFGGIFKASAPQRNSGLLFNESERTGPMLEVDQKIINLSGCPIHPEWLGYTLNMIINHQKILLDEMHRPRELYSNLAHHGCTRNEYFEWKVDAKGFGLKEGCLFYEQGCRGPMTHASCNKILWNEVSSKTRSGTPCFGCTEPDFPKQNFFNTKTNMSIPEDVPLGVPKRNYLTMAGIAKTFHIKRLEGKLIDYKTTP
ncbi:hydrogenase [Sulfurimonas paralvinellae]|uniref:Hydrogenase n=1 Tax=Sulfurimonas paralvinellae TaxID=317658 RepID=A0A7M1BAQ8_9BACT|nr:hydrogenase [Sulfurimonas paralvinellae]QOP46800.1 hydrogenase [Sulfurimonas paralvinellae]